MFVECIIDENFESIVANLNIKSLLPTLFVENVITSLELEDLTSLAQRDANVMLLKLLSQKPKSIFRQFLNALKNTRQHDIYSACVDSGLIKDFTMLYIAFIIL